MLKTLTNKFLSPTNAVITKPLHLVLFSFLVCALFLVAILCLLPVQIAGNDDDRIMGVFAGYFTGEPFPYIPFISILFGYMVSGLYALTPVLPWYAIFLIFVKFVSSVIITYCISEVASKYKLPFIFCILFVLLFLFGFAFKRFLYLSYHFTSVLTVSAAIALAITLTPKNGRNSLLRFVLIITLCFLSFSIRHSMFYPGAIILGSILCFKTLKSPKGIFRSGEFILVAFLILMIITLNVFSTHKAKVIAGEEGIEWQKYRSLVTDFTNFDLIDAEEMGIDQSELNLISKWCFLSENTGTELFSKIANTYSRKEGLSVNRIKDLFRLYFSFYSPHTVSFFYIILLFLLLFAVYCRFFVFKEKNYDILKSFNISNKLLGFIFILYFGYNIYLLFIMQRLNYVTFWGLIYTISPVIIISLCALYGKPVGTAIEQKNMLNEIVRFDLKNRFRAHINMKIFTIILLISCIFLSGLGINIRQLREHAKRNESIANTIVEYITRRPRNLYVHDNTVGFSFAPFKVYRHFKPTNIMFWGGWDYLQPAYYKQLEVNGMETLNWRSFLNDNVFFMTRCAISGNEVILTNSGLIFLQYLHEKYLEFNIDHYKVVVDVINTDNNQICIIKHVVTTN